jgi:uncharacterized protein DUF5662
LADVEAYDSTNDTIEHIDKVQYNIEAAIHNLEDRLVKHDQSKLVDPEKAAWDIATPKLADYEYGSDEYRATLREIKPAIEHHYKVNDHHPEHYENGIQGMSLMALIEMLADWKAATERSPGGDLGKSFEHNQKRWGYSDELSLILHNTAVELGYI